MDVRALFWDVGGVLLTNAWDHTERAAALEQFGLNEKEFHDRHEAVVESFEKGKTTLDEYLDQTVFYRPRLFAREAFKEFMFSLSHPIPEVLKYARTLASTGKYFMGTINNESRELNQYRIDKFEFRPMFRVFVSSCFVGLRKPDGDIYRLALETTQFNPEECIFIDDRKENLESPAKMGMHTIQMQNVEQLGKDLEKIEVHP
ncbi:MAG: HAD family phosphatase [Candidatus Sulfotelmatobacter sp.]